MKGCAKVFVVGAGLCFLSCAGLIWIGTRAVDRTRDPARPTIEKTASPPVEVPQPEGPLEGDSPKVPSADVAEPNAPLSGLHAEELLAPLRIAGYSIDPQIMSVEQAKRMSVENRYSWTCTDPAFSGELKRRSVFFEGDGPDRILLVEVSVLHPSLSAAQLRTEAEKAMTLVAKVVLGVDGTGKVRGALAQLNRDKMTSTKSGSEVRFISGDRAVWISANKRARAMGIHSADPKDIAEQEQKATEDRFGEATRMLDLAEPFLKRGDVVTAKKRLTEILDRFPGTPAAEEATELLKSLE